LRARAGVRNQATLTNVKRKSKAILRRRYAIIPLGFPELKGVVPLEDRLASVEAEPAK